MKVLNPCNDLMQEPTRLFFLNPLVFNNVLKQLSASCILHYQVQLFWSFNYLVQLNNIWMPDHLQDVNLSSYSFYIVYVDNFVFLQDFDCDFLTCEIVKTQLDFAKRPLSYSFGQHILPNIGLFPDSRWFLYSSRYGPLNVLTVHK